MSATISIFNFMKLRTILASVILLAVISGCQRTINSKTNSYSIEKNNGKIILAYKAFEDFLDSDKSWNSYKALVLDACPEVWEVHNSQLKWGGIDSAGFPKEVTRYTRRDYEHYFTQYSFERLNYLYDTIIERAHSVLPPVMQKKVDLCFFLPYGSCFVLPGDERNIIFISMRINPADVEKIMAHEYSHVLHLSRRPEEPLTLARELISEGMAVYLTNKIVRNLNVKNSVPFMPESSFEWCMEHEKVIKDSIKPELSDTTDQLFKRYISDGSFASPPAGFVQKTGYFTGYRIIEACIRKGMTLEEVCALESGQVIERSGYFK